VDTYLLQDVVILRQRLRILGALIGNAQQGDIRESIPLLLQPEEVTLALESGWIRLFDDSVGFEVPDSAVKHRYFADKEEEGRLHLKQYVEKRTQEIRKFKGTASKMATSRPTEIGGEPEKEVPVILREEEYEYTKIAAGIDTRYWHRNDRTITVEEWRRSFFPRNVMEELRLRVFVDLWEKGYYLSPASKFGGDYLVYPGDPAEHHSRFVVLVIKW